MKIRNSRAQNIQFDILTAFNKDKTITTKQTLINILGKKNKVLCEKTKTFTIFAKK